MLPSEGDLNHALEAVLRSKTFARSSASRDLLVFLSKKLLAGEDVSSVKIAREFLKLPVAKASPKNPIVRVQISRLRALLEKFYTSEGTARSHCLCLQSGNFNLSLKAGLADQSNFSPIIKLLDIANIGGDTFQDHFCLGIHQELSHLLGKSRDIRLVLSNESIHAIGKHGQASTTQDGASDYILYGTVRSIPQYYRVLIYLMDAESKQVVWSEEFLMSQAPANAFDFQRDIAEQVISALVSRGGVIERMARHKTPDGSPYSAVLHFYEYLENYSPQTHQLAKKKLLKAVADVPLYAEAWACLSGVYCNEFMFGLDGNEASLELALDAAKKALQITPDSVMGMYAIALAYFYKAEKTLFFDYAEKVISAASFRVDVLATIGLHTAYAGHWEQGMAYLQRAVQLNRNHPTWYWFPFAANFYRLGQYEEALTAAMKLNMPEFDWEALFLSAIHGQLGNLDKSKKFLNRARALKPAIFKNLEGYVGRIFKDDAFRNHFLDGLPL